MSDPSIKYYIERVNIETAPVRRAYYEFCSLGGWSRDYSDAALFNTRQAAERAIEGMRRAGILVGPATVQGY